MTNPTPIPVEALQFIAEEHDAGRHDGLPEPCPAHDAITMWALARQALPAAEREAEVKAMLVEALERAARKFREYEALHMKKQTMAGDEKAEANAVEAEACEAVLKAASTGGAE